MSFEKAEAWRKIAKHPLCNVGHSRCFFWGEKQQDLGCVLDDDDDDDDDEDEEHIVTWYFIL